VFEPAVAFGDAATVPPCAVPAEPVELLPPPIWAAPIELSAVLPTPATDPVPPTPVVVPVGVKEADAPGDALSAPDWTAPVDPFDVLPPPIWTTPAQLWAGFSRPPS